MIRRMLKIAKFLRISTNMILLEKDVGYAVEYPQFAEQAV